MRIDMSLSGKQLAAGAALLLGVVLAFGSTLATGPGAGPVNAEAIAEVIVSQQDHVTPAELAQWLIEKRDDFQLIDIREPWKFDDYHIPTAVNVPMSELFTPAGLKRLERGKKIVVYGLGAGHSAQAQLLLALKGYDAYSLKAGISAWWAEVMTPQSLWSEDADPAGYRRAKQIRSHFMGGPGEPQSSAAPAAALPPPPKSAPRKKPATRKKLKLGRGCS